MIIGVVLISGFAVTTVPGCAGKGRYDPATHVYDTNAPADVIIVTAEKVRATALDVFAVLMETEYTHKDALKALNPGIHEFAEVLRRDSQGWLNDLTAAKNEYQRVRDQGAAVKLNAAITFLNSKIVEASKTLASASKTVK